MTTAAANQPATLVLERLRAQGPDAYRALPDGDSWIADCPSCVGRQVLYVHEDGPGGPVDLSCRNGCSADAVRFILDVADRYAHIPAEPSAHALALQREMLDRHLGAGVVREDRFAAGRIASRHWNCPCCGTTEGLHIRVETRAQKRLRCDGCAFTSAELGAALARLPARVSAPVVPLDARRRRPSLIGEALDVLRTVPAEEYIEALTGQPAPAGSTIRCPLPDHDDGTPSFSVSQDAVWYCHGCGGGGGIIDFAAAYWQRSAYGDGFRPLVADVAAALRREIAA